MTNYGVCMLFSEGDTGVARNLKSTGAKLFSYDTVIAQWKGPNVCIVNFTRYSVSTTKHKSNLLTALNNLNRTVKVLKAINVPRGCTGDLLDFVETNSRN